MMLCSVLLLLLLLAESRSYAPICTLTKHVPLFASPSPPIQEKKQEELDAQQLDFVLGYLNKHQSDLLNAFAKSFSELGTELAKANTRSGGSFNIKASKITDISRDAFTLQVQVKQRGPKEPEWHTIQVSMNSSPRKSRQRTTRATLHEPLIQEDPERPAIDDIVRKLNRLSYLVQKPDVTGKLIQLSWQLGGKITQLPENMYLNQVPHNTYVRQHFYNLASQAIVDAVKANNDNLTRTNPRMKITVMFPETNPSMDTYRIGTLLELIREAALRLAEQDLRVKICVQKSMGVGIFTGLPKQLTGVFKLLRMMDWQNEAGEMYEGILNKYIRFGHVGADAVADDDDIFMILAPQSMVGTDSSIIPLLQDMVKAAGDRPVIIVNPDLTDKISSGGQQSIRGRQERMDFADSFQDIFYFANIYVSGTSYFPILGATTKMSIDEPWIAYQRRDLADSGGELYVPILSSENKPDGESILQCFER